MRANARRPLSPMLSMIDAALAAAAWSSQSASRSPSSSVSSASACRQRFNKEARRPRSVRRNCSSVSRSMPLSGGPAHPSGCVAPRRREKNLRAGKAVALELRDVAISRGPAPPPGSDVRSAARSGTARCAGRWPRRARARGARRNRPLRPALASLPMLRGLPNRQVHGYACSDRVHVMCRARATQACPAPQRRRAP